MFKLGPEIVGEAADTFGRLAHHHEPERDVTDEVAVARVADGAVVVGELLQLADVVDNRAGHEQILAGAVVCRQGLPRRGHREHVLEQPAAVGVVHRLGGRPVA